MIRLTLLTLLACVLLFNQAYAQLENTYNPSSPGTSTNTPKDTAIRKPLKPIEDCKFYFQLGAGYNFVSGIGNSENYTENPNGTVTKGNSTGSLAKGATIGVGLGYKLNKNFGLELDLGYIVGGKNKEAYTYSNGVSEKNYYKANTFTINPKITFDVPLTEKVSIYSKLGYLIGLGKGLYHSDKNAFDPNTGNPDKETWDGAYTGGIVSGATGALGMKCHLADNVSFFGELTCNSLSRKFDKYTLQKVTADGHDILKYVYPYYQDIYYVDEATTQTTNTSVQNGNTQTNTSTTTVNLQQPQYRPSYKTNYSSIGFRIGLLIHF